MSCIANTGPPCAAMRLTVASVCGLRMACTLALGLSNRRYVACVLAQSPHASLIGAVGDLASCCALWDMSLTPVALLSADALDHRGVGDGVEHHGLLKDAIEEFSAVP